VDSEALINEMQSAMVNLCNHDEPQVLGTTNDIIPSPPNNSLGEVLSQKCAVSIIGFRALLRLMCITF